MRLQFEMEMLKMQISNRKKKTFHVKTKSLHEYLNYTFTVGFSSEGHFASLQLSQENRLSFETFLKEKFV